MDRREALKKLAVGGALAAGGSMVLSSNNVAFAQSATGPPPATPSMVTQTTVNRKGEGYFQVTAPSAPAGTTPDDTTYVWEILSCSVPNGRTLVLVNPVTGQIIARGQNGGCGFMPVQSPPPHTTSSVVVRTVAGGSGNPKELSPGDFVSLRLTVKWHYGTTIVEGIYTISGTYPNITVS